MDVLPATTTEARTMVLKGSFGAKREFAKSINVDEAIFVNPSSIPSPIGFHGDASNPSKFPDYVY